MPTVPFIPLWLNADSDAALAEGWLLAHVEPLVGPAYFDIQKADDAHVFTEDSAAITHVFWMATSGSALHRKAMEIVLHPQNRAPEPKLRVNYDAPTSVDAATRFVVDGHEFANPESNLSGDGQHPPFRVFDVDKQAYVPGHYKLRADAQTVADGMNKHAPKQGTYDALTDVDAAHAKADQVTGPVTPRYIVDGAERGAKAPFRVYDTVACQYAGLAAGYPTRDAASSAAKRLNLVAHTVTPPRIAKVCARCGSDDLAADAAARWDIAKQEWTLSSVHDGVTCGRCHDDEADVIDVTLRD